MSYLSINIIVSSVSLSELASGTFSETVFPIVVFIFLCGVIDLERKRETTKEGTMAYHSPFIINRV